MSVELLGFLVVDDSDDGTTDVKVGVTDGRVELRQDEDFIILSREHAHDVAGAILRLLEEIA